MISANTLQPLRPAKFNIRVLVAPLDWGLGHATRCIPIINLLLAKGCAVVIAAEGAQETLLKQEYGQIEDVSFISLKGYRIRYAKTLLFFRLMRQLPALRSSIRAEHQWLEKLLSQQKIDWVISDNRYGLWTRQIPCTFITHQLRVQVPALFKPTETLLQKILSGYIEQYSNCWVPDLPDMARGLSGNLGHPLKKPELPVWYIGWLTRLKPAEERVNYRYKCLLILSGPEPQRTLLEKKLVTQCSNFPGKLLLVRGLPGNKTAGEWPENLEVKDHLNAAALQQAMLASEFVISRSGYSTLMDTFTLQKKCIFIPTPGQTEQEYLGRRLAENKMALVFKQEHFNLAKAVATAEDFHFHFPLNSMNDLLEMAIDHFLKAHFEERSDSH